MWCNSSNSMMRITSRITGKPSLHYSCTYSITHFSNSWKCPFLDLPKCLLGGVGMSQFFFHLQPFMNVTLCYAKFCSSCTTVCGISMVIHHQLKICVVASPWAWQKLGTCWFTFFNHIVVSTHNKLTVNYKNFQAAIYKSSIHTQTTYPAMLTLNSESMRTNLKYYGRGRDRHMQWAGNDHCSLWYAVSACTMCVQ